MMALALGEDTLSSRNRREAIIDDLFNLPSNNFSELTAFGELKGSCLISLGAIIVLLNSVYRYFNKTRTHTHTHTCLHRAGHFYQGLAVATNFKVVTTVMFVAVCLPCSRGTKYAHINNLIIYVTSNSQIR